MENLTLRRWDRRMVCLLMKHKCLGVKNPNQMLNGCCQPKSDQRGQQNSFKGKYDTGTSCSFQWHYFQIGSTVLKKLFRSKCVRWSVLLNLFRINPNIFFNLPYLDIMRGGNLRFHKFQGHLLSCLKIYNNYFLVMSTLFKIVKN